MSQKLYTPKEPSLWQKALPYLVSIALAVGLFLLYQTLFSPEHYKRQPAFGMLRITNGWQTALLWLLIIVGIQAAISAATTFYFKTVRKRNLSFWAILGDQVTHVIIWIIIFFAIYPLVYVVFASFDPRNSLFSLAQPQSDWLLFKSKILPDFSRFTWENYIKLFDGVIVPAWQWLLMGTVAVALLTIAAIALYTRATGNIRSTHKPQILATRVLLVSLVILVVAISPSQFTGQGNESKFLLHIRNTLLVSGITGILAIVLSTAAGYAIARLRFPGRYQTLLAFIFVQMFPGFLGLVAVFTLLYQLGLLNTFTGLILAYSSGAIAFNTWMYKGYVESLPISLEEAAMIDGASRWQTFTRIVLPLSVPMLIFIFLNQFIGTYAEFILSSIVLTGVENWTVGISLRSFTSGQFATKWGIFAAASVVGAIPIVLLFYSFQQYFAGGAVAGGVKE